MVIIVSTCFDWYYCVGQAWLQLAQPLQFLISSQDFHRGNCLGCLYYSYATEMAHVFGRKFRCVTDTLEKSLVAPLSCITAGKFVEYLYTSFPLEQNSLDCLMSYIHLIALSQA